MPKVISRSSTGFTHYYDLDVINVVPEFFTGTFNGVAKATGVTGQIIGTSAPAVVNGAYYLCTHGGVTPSNPHQVFQFGHIYKGVSGEWVDQGVKDGQRMVPTINLTGDRPFYAGLEYTYAEDFGRKTHGYNHVTYPTVTPNVSMGLEGRDNPYAGGNGVWRITGTNMATAPECFVEAPSSTMRYGVGNYTIQATRNAGTITVYYTTTSVDQLRQDPRTATWKTASASALNNTEVASVVSPVTGFRIVFSDTTPGLASIMVN